MVGKIGWIIFDGEVVGGQGSAYLSLSFLSGSSNGENGNYIPAESIHISVYYPDEIDKFADQMKTWASKLRDKKIEK